MALERAQVELINQIATDIVSTALQIHKRVGPGMFETVYEGLLARDLSNLGHRVERQKAFPLVLEGLAFDEAFRADLVVDDAVIIEVKSVSAFAPAHEKQLLTYLRVLDYRLGFLLNFGGAYMKDGIRRLANRL